MDEKKQVEFRYYDIPKGDVVFPLTGETWHMEYGEGRDKLHFHNYYEVGMCYCSQRTPTDGFAEQNGRDA